MRKIFANHGMLTIASIDVVSGELRVIAEILKPVAAVATNAISRVQPGNAHAISLLYDSDVSADGIHNSDDLVTRNDGEFRQREVSLHNVQIRVADSAAAYLRANLSRTRDRKCDLLQGQRRGRHPRRSLKNHCAHIAILSMKRNRQSCA